MLSKLDRRHFIFAGATGIASSLFVPNVNCASASMASSSEKPLFKISLAQWSLHKALKAGKLDNLDFAKTAKSLDIHAVEFVNQFFIDKAKDTKYLKELKTRANDIDVKMLLIMIDREGNLGDPDEKKRTKAVENHYKWVEAAKYLGCHSIRVNARSGGTYDEQLELAAMDYVD